MIETVIEKYFLNKTLRHRELYRALLPSSKRMVFSILFISNRFGLLHPAFWNFFLNNRAF